MSEAKTIQQMMDEFLISLNADYTQKTYATPLKHFGTFLAGVGVHVDRDSVGVLAVDHAIDFVPWLRYECFPDPDQPAKATLQLYLTAVYRFYRSLLKRGVSFEASDIARLEETYRDARNIRGEPRPKDPKLSAVEAIIEAARSVLPISGEKAAQRRLELARLRDVAIVEMLRSTGCRVGELIALRRGDLDWLAHSALVKGKGSKYRKVYLDETAWSALKVYLQARQDGAADARGLARLPVFCGHGNRSGRTPSPLTTRHVARIVQDLAEKAGIAEVGVSPHYFRHVFATRALDRTENLALVQDMLGHASPATTRVYARTDEKQRKEGYARVWDDSEGFQQAVMAAELPAAWERCAPARPNGLASAGASLSRAASSSAGPLREAARTWPDAEGRLLRVALVELFLSGNVSLEELSALRAQDVDTERHRLWLPSSHRGAARHAGRHALDLREAAWVALEAYLAWRDERDVSEALFCMADGSPLTTAGAFETLCEIATRAAVEETDLQALL
jgi:site-specific recombinase XerD